MSIYAAILVYVVLVVLLDASWDLMLVNHEGTKKIQSYVGSFSTVNPLS